MSVGWSSRGSYLLKQLAWHLGMSLHACACLLCSSMLALCCICCVQLKVLCEGVVETVGRLRVGDWSTPFTAHPKLDASTGNLHIIGYNIDRQPYLNYGVLSPNGSLLK